MTADYSQFEENIGYTFRDKNQLRLALTHSSFANENPKIFGGQYNERIEFLGDAVLELIVSDYLYNNFPEKDEGAMTRTRASLVCEFTLAQCARQINLGSFIYLSRGEELTGGRKRDSILSDAFESVLGAIYLDGGYEPARSFVHRILLTDIESKELFYDAKTRLQEIVQEKKGQSLNYSIVKETGPEHDKHFTAQVDVNGKVLGVGEGHTKKNAEQHAAYQALLTLKKE